MIKQLFFTLILLLATLFAFSQNKTATSQPYQSPKLVVGIVVDQMRYDYLTRFYNHYGEGGFKRMMNEGFHFKNNHFNYIPTYTGPGHASVYTGTSPSLHGIIANNWYDKTIKTSVYCAQDDNVTPVGTQHKAGKMSPHRMITTSITDELRLATQQRAKVIGIGLKDRGAILPAGHSGTAYWFHGKDEGNWISSSFYMNNLPKWVNDFNNSNKAQSYLKTWNTLKPIATYIESGPDDSPYEKKFKGTEKSVFPYDLRALAPQNDNFDIIKETAFGNDITTDFAIAAIDGENLGNNNTTDFLAISYSSPDYVGHTFGINSKEIQDTYLRLDQDLERLFKHLDNKLGKNNYTVFLTADHGAVHAPGYLQSQNIPAGFFNRSAFEEALNKHLNAIYNSEDLIENVSSDQVFLNHQTIQSLKLNTEEVEKAVAQFVLQYPQMDKAFTRHQLGLVHYTSGIGALIQNGFNQKRSGDILYTHTPAVISTWYEDGGTTHGSGYTYDTHVPLLFMGQGIQKGKTYKKSEITDIAPTLSALLGIARPNGATGRVLNELFE